MKTLISNIKIYELSHQKNIRDLGGLKGANGKTIKYGRIYRGGALEKVNEEDVKVIKSFNLTDIVDFRSKGEFIHHPDLKLDNVRYHNFTTFDHEHKKEDIQHDDGNLLWFMNKGDTGFMHLSRTYRELVDTEEGQAAYRNLFKIIMADGNPVVYFHCSQGKDRVGVGAYLIESALGVDMETIKEDYLYSNVAMEKRKDCLVNSVKDRPFFNEQYKKDLLEVFSAKLEYLQEAIDIIDSKYGGVMSYLENVLNVDVKKMRELFLE